MAGEGGGGVVVRMGLVKDEEEAGQCNLYSTNSLNKTDPFHLGNPYGGIPTNLLINLLVWALLMVLFVVVRKSAYRFIRVQNIGEMITPQLPSRSKFTELFFSGFKRADVGETHPAETDSADNNEARAALADNDAAGAAANGPTIPEAVLADIIRFENETEAGHGAGATSAPATIVVSSATATAGDATAGDASEADTHGTDESRIIPRSDAEDDEESTREEIVGSGFWSWLAKVFSLTDSQIRHLAGRDAFQYLRFQRYILAYMAVTTTLSLTVILPLNFQGKQEGNVTDFGHTTLSNLEPTSPFLWAHITIAFLLFPAAIFMMRRFSFDLHFRDPSMEVTRTLAVENIPVSMCQREVLQRHFAEAYPSISLHDLQLVYDVSELTSLSKELRNVSDSLHYGERYRADNGKDLYMYPYSCARCCCCLCAPCRTPVAVVDYYKQQKSELELAVQKQKEIAIHSPLGIAFVTFNSINDAKQVYNDHHGTGLFRCRPTQPLSTFSSSLKPASWKVWFAPPPKDIYWENLSVKRTWLILKIILSNILLFIMALFLTTPEYVVSKLDYILISIGILKPQNDGDNIGSWVQDFLPTILLWTFTALLPLLVSYSDRWLGRWTRSEENHSVMRKTFWYLLFMVVIFPTFGFTTGFTFFKEFFAQNSTGAGLDSFRWECVFLPDSGAFFVNYVITAWLIGTALELMRFPELFLYTLRICFSKSRAETPAIQREVTYEFQFGEQYARMLMIFSMVMMYSLSCPLITPFGCLYFLFKHYVDRHNLAFVYAPSKINKKVHASAIHFVIMSVALLQLFMLTFSIIRNGTFSNSSGLEPITKYAIALFFITINVFTAQIWSSFCMKLSPIKYEDVMYQDHENDEHSQPYIPSVLKETMDPNQNTGDDSPTGYGYHQLGLSGKNHVTQHESSV